MLPIEEARVSVLDRGFLLGDGVYEVIPAYGGQLFRLHQHLARLQRSLDSIRIENPYSITEWEEILTGLVSQNETSELSVYLQVTRGVAAKRDHVFSENMTPTVFAMCNPITQMSDEVLKKGVSAITLDDIRWKRCDIKAITLLANVMLRQQALDQGAAEAILVNHGHALEGAASNLFIVQDGLIITPPEDHQLLSGVTRDLVLELAARHAIAYEERAVKQSELLSADEIWLTSSTREILPVTLLDEKPVGSGQPGQVWHKMIELYRAYKQQLRSGKHA